VTCVCPSLALALALALSLSFSLCKIKTLCMCCVFLFVRVCLCVCAWVRVRIGTLQPQLQRRAATHPAGLIIAAKPASTYVLHDRSFVRTPSAATRSFCPTTSRPPRRASRVLDKNNPRRLEDGETRRLYTQHQAEHKHHRRSNPAPCDGGSISAVFKDG